MPHGGAAIIQRGLPGTDDGLFHQLLPRQVQGGGLDGFEGSNRGLTQPRGRQGVRVRREDAGQAFKLVDQPLGQGFDIALADGAVQDQIQQFVSGQAIGPALQEPFPQTLSVAVVMRFFSLDAPTQTPQGLIIERFVQALGRGGKYLYAVRRDAEGVFELGGQRFVPCDGGPAVVHHLHLPGA